MIFAGKRMPLSGSCADAKDPGEKIAVPVGGGNSLPILRLLQGSAHGPECRIATHSRQNGAQRLAVRNRALECRTCCGVFFAGTRPPRLQTAPVNAQDSSTQVPILLHRRTL